jgi:hypothetical protein
MKRIHALQIKHLCLKYAMDNGLTIVRLTDTDFEAKDSEVVVNVPIEHLYSLIQQGWSVDEVLQNETNGLG